MAHHALIIILKITYKAFHCYCLINSLMCLFRKTNGHVQHCYNIQYIFYYAVYVIVIHFYISGLAELIAVCHAQQLTRLLNADLLCRR